MSGIESNQVKFATKKIKTSQRYWERLELEPKRVYEDRPAGLKFGKKTQPKSQQMYTETAMLSKFVRLKQNLRRQVW